MRILLADDEPLALRGLHQALKGEPGVEIVGLAQDGAEALRLIHAERPDLVFLDVRMPKLNGLEVAAAMNEMDAPDIVFVTAFDGYAAEAFAVEAVDYLLKPLRLDRLRQSLQRARRRRAERETHGVRTADPPPFLRVQNRFGDRDVAQTDIVWIEAAKDYALIHTEAQTYILRTTMSALGKRLGPGLIRAHRSAFVSLGRIQQTAASGKGLFSVTLEDGTEVQVGPSYTSSVRTALRNRG